jgi:hypothetical protein
MAAALPRLAAEEELRAVRVSAAGAGNLEQGELRDYLDSLERISARRTPMQRSRKDRLARLGISVVEERVPLLMENIAED